jgi:hypothetical protein
MNSNSPWYYYRLSAQQRPTSHLVVPTINILRQAFNHEELEILVENNESNDEESDSDLDDVNDHKKEMSKLSLETFADLSYLNNSKDAMDVKLL